MPQRPSVRRRVAHPPARRLVVFDAGCAFCRERIEAWTDSTRGGIDRLASTEAAARFREIPAAVFDASLVLIEPDGTACTGAEAILRLKSASAPWKAILAAYESITPLRLAMEFAYRLVARHRTRLPAKRHRAHLDGGAPESAKHKEQG